MLATRGSPSRLSVGEATKKLIRAAPPISNQQGHLKPAGLRPALNPAGPARALGRTWDHGTLRPLAGESPERIRVSPPSPASQPVQKNQPVQNQPAPSSQKNRPGQAARLAPGHTDQAVIRNFCVIAHI